MKSIRRRFDRQISRASRARVAFLAGAALALTSGVEPTAARVEAPHILAATNDLGAIARAVLGPDADIRVVARPDRDLHAVDVRPSMMTAAAKADVYLAVGLSLDMWSTGIVQGSRNDKLTVIDCSTAVTPLEVPSGKVDASMGDVHPYGNPHYWLDPENGKALARFLAERFGSLDAPRAGTYRANAERFASDIDSRMPAWTAALQGRSFVEYHRTWVYAAERFGMTIEGQIEPLPGIPPTAQHLVSLAALIRDRKVGVVARDAFQPEGPLAFLARETGVRVVVLHASCAEPTPGAYFTIFDSLAEVFRERS
jgi:zinc/manganese transport system substrate-binding protein